MNTEEIHEKAREILRTWDKEDLISDILELTTDESLEDWVKESMKDEVEK